MFTLCPILLLQCAFGGSLGMSLVIVSVLYMFVLDFSDLTGDCFSGIIKTSMLTLVMTTATCAWRWALTQYKKRNQEVRESLDNKMRRNSRISWKKKDRRG
ncbi:hypothetical protein RND81_05G075500 [Saponaria officinalis]|uniref:Uncharacterized protein n=1 Tax=Saponaria officinalis TaxID=3572 RepID=A0AAW1KV51_SAPOF